MGQNDLQPVTNFDDSFDQAMFEKPPKMSSTFVARPDIWVSKAGQERQTLRNTELIPTSSAKSPNNRTKKEELFSEMKAAAQDIQS